jgi:epoxyqueuosine reductase
LPYAKDYCGTCTACIDACPTNAILPNKELAANQCISYFTIELKDATLPTEYRNKFDDWIFGCDICQDVCPWNSFSKPHQEEKFLPNEQLNNFTNSDWENLTEEGFKIVFGKSAVKRTKLKGILRNIKMVKK